MDEDNLGPPIERSESGAELSGWSRWEAYLEKLTNNLGARQTIPDKLYDLIFHFGN